MNTQSYILDTAKVRIILDTVFIHPSVRAEKAKSQRRKSEGTGKRVFFTDYRDDKRNNSKIISTFIGDKRIVR